MVNIPTRATQIEILSDVPFHVDYQHVRHFVTRGEQQSYFDSRAVLFSNKNMSFQRHVGTQESIIKIPLTQEQIDKANYCRFKNSDTSNKWYYAFITRCEYINEGRTDVYMMIDVYQTYYLDCKFNPSFIEREHCLDNPTSWTLDEGLEIGSDYDIMSVNRYHSSEYAYIVFATSEAIHFKDRTSNIKSADRTTVLGTVTPLHYYIIPIELDTMKLVKMYDSKDFDSLDDYFNALFKDEKNVNKVQFMYITENIGIRNNPKDPDGDIGNGLMIRYIEFEEESLAGGTIVRRLPIITVSKITKFEKLVIKTGSSKYGGLREPTNQKLYTHPFTIYELSDSKGNIFPFKQEYWNAVDYGSGLNYQLTSFGSIGTEQHIMYTVDGYNAKTSPLLYSAEQQFGIVNRDSNNVPIISDYTATMLQSSRNAITQTYANNDTQLSSNMFSVASGAASQSPTNPISGVVGAMDGSQKALVSHHMTEANLNAKMQDAQNMPPTVTKMGNSNAFDFGYKNNGVTLIKKQIKKSHFDRVDDYFTKYGYKVNRLKLPNLETRPSFNYVKTVNCNLKGTCNNDILLSLKNIFDSGVTLWHANDVGNYNLKNTI